MKKFINLVMLSVVVAVTVLAVLFKLSPFTIATDVFFCVVWAGLFYISVNQEKIK
jgi:hypothetical protein